MKKRDIQTDYLRTLHRAIEDLISYVESSDSNMDIFSKTVLHFDRQTGESLLGDTTIDFTDLRNIRVDMRLTTVVCRAISTVDTQSCKCELVTNKQ